MSDKKISTKCVQGGYQPKNGEPRQLPIIQSTTFKYDKSQDMADLFDLKASGYFYTRLQNPTNDSTAGKICELEGGSAAMLTASGQAASFFSVFNIAQAGDHVVASSELYGGTFNLFDVTMRKMGIDFTFISPDASEEELRAAFQDNTKCYFGESVCNPSLAILDFELVTRVAHEHGVPVIIDNTFPTPVNFRPFEHGVDIVVHSTTKYMDGHGSSVGGAIVDSGNFPWDDHADKFPGLTIPDESYHGLTYTDAFGQEGAYITKATAQLMRDLGVIPSPFNAYLLNMNLEDLHLRVARHVENAQKVAEFLEGRDDIEFVNYPGLSSNKYYERAQKYMPNGTSGVIGIGIKGGREEAEKFLNSLEMVSIATHVADARSCALHPASATHRQLDDQALADAGVAPNLVRLSCGIEDADDIIADVKQALESL